MSCRFHKLVVGSVGGIRGWVTIGAVAVGLVCSGCEDGGSSPESESDAAVADTEETEAGGGGLDSGGGDDAVADEEAPETDGACDPAYGELSGGLGQVSGAADIAYDELWEYYASRFCAPSAVIGRVEVVDTVPHLYVDSPDNALFFDMTELAMVSVGPSGPLVPSEFNACARGAWWPSEEPLPDGIPCKFGPGLELTLSPAAYWVVLSPPAGPADPCSSWGLAGRWFIVAGLRPHSDRYYPLYSAIAGSIAGGNGFDDAMKATIEQGGGIGNQCALRKWMEAAYTEEEGGSPCSVDEHCAATAPSAPLGDCDSWGCVDFQCQVKSDSSTDGDACSLPNPCTISAACSGGQCVPTETLNCNDGNACTADSCVDNTTCAHEFEPGLPCTDVDACTSNDVCVSIDTCVGVADACPCETAADCPQYFGPKEDVAYACGATGHCVLIGEAP